VAKLPKLLRNEWCGASDADRAQSRRFVNQASFHCNGLLGD
jgi:hypothetical protein